MVTVKSVLWFNLSPGASCVDQSAETLTIGIVLVHDDETNMHSARIGIGCGRSEQIDSDLIMKWGARFPASAARSLFRNINPQSIEE